MKCNYNDWTTAVVKTVTPRMRAALRVMVDGECRTRAAMLWAAGIDPNPRSARGFVGNERTDYYLYKQGLLNFVGMEGQQKVFQISAKGREVVNK